MDPHNFDLGVLTLNGPKHAHENDEPMKVWDKD